jgi:tyrosine-protein kinase Etk/Wzc
VLRSTLKEKAAAILDNLIHQHNLDAIADKNQVSRNTAEFINDRIKFITGELSTVEEEAEQFKTTHRLVDVESEAKLFLQTGTESAVNILEANTQKVLADYMYDYVVKNDKPGDLIPANLGLSEENVGNMIGEYNKLVLDRNRILRNSSESNPVVQSLDGQLNGIRKSIKESLNNFREALDIRIRELMKQETGINSKIADVPRYEREYRIIQRQQQIKETLYLYLLQKREETNIALAVTVANAKVIDRAYSKKEPVSPKRKIIFLIAVAIGLAIPLIVLYIRDLLDNKVHGKRDIDRTGIPFLGDIPLAETSDKVVLARGENSSVAEAFRLLRTNVDFMLGSTKKKGNTIFLTSTLSKEGKSYIAMNLATSIAISGKKVLLIGLDVRAPKILQYFGLEDKYGLTNFVSDRDVQLSSVIIKAPGTDHLDLLPSGTIPPNPAELLMHPRIAEMFEMVKGMYDYIIVDTAPIGMVTDTLLLSDYADAFVYVVRAYYLDRRLLSVPTDLYREKRLPNMAILINGTDKQKGYGYGYGYGYGGYGYGHEKPRPFLKRLLGKKA